MLLPIIQFDREKGKVNEPMNVTITFTNPLPKPLTNITITMEGAGLVAPTIQKLK